MPDSGETLPDSDFSMASRKPRANLAAPATTLGYAESRALYSRQSVLRPHHFATQPCRLVGLARCKGCNRFSRVGLKGVEMVEIKPLHKVDHLVPRVR